MTGTYVPLARKWRPRAFSDVVGQEEIVRALSNAVSQDRLAHAYLFSGPRGVGKTTNARLLASAINCRKSDHPTPNPCGTCESCVEIHEGRSMDALEIDGATHGKVDQARDLIEVVSYAPVRDRRKVFIIDEVHAISSAAFQALLKTLEEPPAHAVFILATTERHKIPATILSRCQRFDFRRLTDDEVASRLADVAQREGYHIGDAAGATPGAPRAERSALAALAAAATGSLRDGLSLFDQAVAQTGGNVTAADVAALLGSPDRTALVALFASILSGDRAAVLRAFSELDASGAEPRSTLHDLTALVRGAVRLAADPASMPPSGLSEDGASRLAGFARSTPYETLLRLLALLVESDGLLRRSDLPSLALEVLLLKLTELPRLVPIEDLIAGRAGSIPTGPAVASPARAALAPAAPLSPVAPVSPSASRQPVPPRPDLIQASPARDTPSGRVELAPTPATPAMERAPEPEPRFVGLTTLDIEPEAVPPEDRAATFRAAVEKRHSNLSAVLDDASVTVDGKNVVIVFDPPSPLAERRLGEPSMKKVLEDAAIAILGRGARVVVEGREPLGGDLRAAAAAADGKTLEAEHLKRKVAGDERVRKMLDLFDGEIAEVRRDEGDH